MDRREKAFEFATEASKLLITLGTAFVAFTVTFSEQLGGLAVESFVGRWLLMGAWGAFTLSVGCGVWAQLALTQELEPRPDSAASKRDPSIRSRPVKAAFRWQVATFVLATALGASFGVWRLHQPTSTSSKPTVGEAQPNPPLQPSAPQNK